MRELDDAAAVKLLHEHLNSYIALYEAQALNWEDAFNANLYFIIDIDEHYRPDATWRNIAGDVLQVAADAANLKKMFAEKKKNKPRMIE